MTLSNVTNKHLQLYAALAAALVMSLIILIVPMAFIIRDKYSIFWLIPAWGIGQGIVYLWMTKIVSPLSLSLAAAEKNPFLLRYDLRKYAIGAGILVIAYASYSLGHRDGRYEMDRIVQQNCGTSLTCHAKYTFDHVKARKRAERQSEN